MSMQDYKDLSTDHWMEYWSRSFIRNHFFSQRYDCDSMFYFSWNSSLVLVSRKYGDYTQPYPVASSYHYDPLPPPPTFSSPTDPTHPHPSPSLQVTYSTWSQWKLIWTTLLLSALDRGACVWSPWVDPGPPGLLLLLPSSLSATCKRHKGGPGRDAGEPSAKVLQWVVLVHTSTSQ